MGYFNRELRGGAPAEVYWFRSGSTDYGVHTTQDVARTVAFDAAVSLTGGVVVYDVTPLPITRESVDVGSDTSDRNLKITVPATSTVGALFVGQRPIFTLTLGIYRVHRGDVNAKRIFVGEVVGAAVAGVSVILDCAPMSAAIKRPMLRVLYQTPCNHNLYDANCGVDRDAFDTSGSIDAIATDGVTLTISEADALADGYFTAGMLKFGNEYGFIRSHVGDQVVLLRPVPSLAVSSSVTLYAGCDRSLATCTTKFSNTANHLGFPFIPTLNPHTDGVAD